MLKKSCTRGKETTNVCFGEKRFFFASSEGKREKKTFVLMSHYIPSRNKELFILLLGG